MKFWQDRKLVGALALASGFSAVILVIQIFALPFLPTGRIIFSNGTSLGAAILNSLGLETPPQLVVTHIETPDPLKAVYFTSWAAGHPKFREQLFDLVETTEINAVVIDVKDYTGRISFKVDDPYLKQIGAAENRIPDVKEFVARLHERGVYVIARISSFQDSYLINIHPEWAVKTKDGTIWKDYKGIKWLDAGAKPVWDYLVAIGRQSYAYGFDELNFDYIRYPSDGDLTNIYYSWSEGRTRTEVMKSFYLYLREQFATTTIPLSIDLFGLTTSANNDLGIGQNLKDALPYFDYVSPMVYPSHFSKGYLGLNKPAEHPYEVVKNSMDRAIERAYEASSTPDKIRPWLQAFNLGATYTPAMVQAQIQATYDAGLTSWMLWHAGSVYNKEGLVPNEEESG